MRIGIGFPGTESAADSLELVRAAEVAGVDSVWSAEHLGYHDAVVASSLFLSETERLDVGIVGVSPFSRHPGLLAMEVAALMATSQGRLRLQAGTGDPRLAAKLGLDPLRSPLQDIEAFIGVLRDLLGGRTVTAVAPSFSLREYGIRGGGSGYPLPPIHLMAIRPKMLALACKIADGASLSFGSSRPYLRATVESARATLTRLGRDRGEFDISAWVQCFVYDDLDEATAHAARHVVRSVLSDSFAVLGAGADGDVDRDRVRREFEAGGARRAAGLLPPELVRGLAMVATPDTLADVVDEYRATGLDEIILTLAGPRDGRLRTIADLGRIVDATPVTAS